jgi:ATP-dependent RNA circularization protein (DNA/RNA ligase family)
MKYQKINSVFKRDPETKNKRFLIGEYSLPEIAYLSECPWLGTEKIDGTNIRISSEKDGIKGKTDNAQIPSFLYPVLVEIQNKLQTVISHGNLPESTIIYGEGYGKKIQKGEHYLPESNNFVLFDVSINGKYQPWSSVENVSEKIDVPIVPIYGYHPISEWVKITSEGRFKASLLHPHANNEEFVLRLLVDLYNRNGDRIITKLKFKDFQ